MALCPYCGNLLNGADPNFCDYCQRVVTGPAAVSVDETSRETEGEHNSLGVFDRCPSCGKSFAGKVVNTQQIDSSDILKKDVQPQAHFANRYPLIAQTSPIDNIFKTTRITYRCKYCEFEWSKDKTDRVVIHIPDHAEDLQYWENKD